MTPVTANRNDKKNTSITEVTSITPPNQIIEAQSLQRDIDGEIILIAATTPQAPAYSVPKC